jgi:predicted glycoside hydrolase/deacetylase ChbG (UPF0249 family)
MLREHPAVDVGIHLVLTSEWDHLKWRPLTEAQSIKDSNGYFFPMIWPNKNYPNRALLQNQWKIEDVEKEWRAQIEMGKRNIPRLSHISGHMGCTSMSKDVQALAKKLAREYNLDIDPTDFSVKQADYKGPSKTTQEKKKSFIKMLQQLEPGNTYMFVDHPGLNTEELKAIHHAGYGSVAIDRQGVTDVWTDKEVKALIRKKGIRLISYKDLIQNNIQ